MGIGAIFVIDAKLAMRESSEVGPHLYAPLTAMKRI